MTRAEIEAALARAEAATPGPWDWWCGAGYRDDQEEKVWRLIDPREGLPPCPLIAGDPNMSDNTYDPEVVIRAGCGYSEYVPCEPPDAVFIAAARTDVAAMAAALLRSIEIVQRQEIKPEDVVHEIKELLGL